MKLTENFTFEEMTFSQTAIRNKVKNIPDEEQTENLKSLCENVLEKLRILINSPIRVSSGFRNKFVNHMVGGKPTSQHLQGEAADTIATKYTVREYYNLIKKLVDDGKLEVDQCILEFNSWVHISYTAKRKNRNQFFEIS